VIRASRADQRRLLDLQEIDTAIRQLEHRRANLPEQKALDENAATLDEVTTEFSTSKDRLARLEKDQRWHEAEIATAESRRKTQDAQLYSGRLSTEREVDAVRAELSQLRVRKNDLEDALLEIMEQVEELEAAVTRLRGRHGELTGQVDELTKARDEAALDIDAELEEQRGKRAEVATDIPDEAVAHYDDLRGRKQGVGVAALSRRTCQGCRLELTQVELDGLLENAANGIAHCEQCGRILVIV